MELVNLKYNCRICLKPRKGFEDVYRYVVEGFKDPLVQLVFSLFEIQLQTHKAYPQFMCKRCLNKLTHILLFKQEMIQNQEILFGLFKASHSSYVEKKIDFRESMPPKYSSAVSNWIDRDDFELKIDGLVDDRITIKRKPLSSPKLRSSVQSQESSRYLDRFQSHLSVKGHSRIDYQPTQILSENFPTKITRSTRDPESQLQQSSKIKCRENIHKIFTDLNQANNIDSNIYVKKEIDFDDSARNNVDLQASFLQNLNLITLQHAQILKNLQEQSIRTRQIGALLKGSRHTIANTSKYRVKNSRLNLPPKQIKANTRSIGLRGNISNNILSRTRHKKLNAVEVKPEKRFCQSNVVSKVEDKDKGILKTSLVPLVHSTVRKTDAISKQIGCEADYQIRRLSTITPKQSLVSTFRLNHKRDKCNINGDNFHNNVIEKVEIVTEKKKKANRLRSTKRVKSNFVRTDLSSLNSELLTNCLHYNVPPDIIVNSNTDDRMSSQIQGKSEEKNFVRRTLRSSGSTEEISEKYDYDRNLRNRCMAKRKFSTRLCSLSSSRPFHISPVPYNNNLERKADMRLIDGSQKLSFRSRKVNVVNSCIELGNKDSTTLRKTDSAVLDDSKLDLSRIHSVAHQKRKILISELQSGSPKSRIRKSNILSRVDLINNNSKVNAICTGLDLPSRDNCYGRQIVRAPRKVGVGKRKRPTCIISDGTNIKGEYTSCNSLNNVSDNIKCQIARNSIDADSCAVDVKQLERKLRRSNYSQNVCGYKLEIKSNNRGHSNHIERLSVSESNHSKRSNEVRHYPLDCKTRIVNIDDNHELQLSVISGDSPLSNPNTGSSQTLACLDTTTHLKAENCYFAFDSKYCFVKLEPEANIKLKRKRHPPVIYSPPTSPHKNVAKRKVYKDFFMKIGQLSNQEDP